MEEPITPCVYHKNRQGNFYCGKYNRYLCDECLICQDPSLYCKFRTSCIVWELSRHPEEKAENC